MHYVVDKLHHIKYGSRHYIIQNKIQVRVLIHLITFNNQYRFVDTQHHYQGYQIEQKHNLLNP